MGIFEQVITQSSRKPEGLPGVIERRKTKRLPMLRASHAGLTSNRWDLEFIPAFGLVRLTNDIDALAKRSLDRNVFFEADVVNSAWPRLTSLLAPKGCWMLCLWETIGEVRMLRLFMPVRLAFVGLPRRKVLQPLSNEFMPNGTPLIDAECAEEATETLLRLLADPVLKMPTVIDFTHQIVGRSTFETMKTAAKRLGLEQAESATHQRAAIRAASGHADYPRNVLKKKSLDEYARLLRRLGDQGEIVFHTARKTEEVLDAFERFLALELQGWKGRRGTALYNHRKIAAFSRQVVVELAARGRCEIHSLVSGERLVSALILFHSEGHVVPWKICFDEELARFSPGVQIMLHATRSLLERDNFIGADSLAHENHWMINRLWPDRVTVTDLAVQLTSSRRLNVADLVGAKEREQRWKDVIKGWLRRN
ncbi:MAG: GNAT family N-acetyltransferase [Ahrensia sp.]|nr:GNAT family N-acetyltransferase [Ahrensia sp.]